MKINIDGRRTLSNTSSISSNLQTRKIKSKHDWWWWERRRIIDEIRGEIRGEKRKTGKRASVTCERRCRQPLVARASEALQAARVIAARPSRSDAYLFCVLLLGYLGKRETARSLSLGFLIYTYLLNRKEHKVSNGGKDKFCATARSDWISKPNHS